MAISTKPASGMRDFLAGAVMSRRRVVDVIQKAYESHGFVPLETPAMERLDVLLGKYGDEGDQLIFRILKRGDLTEAMASGDLADMALRYDLTVPLARVVAQYGAELPKFYKRYQIQPVWRADRPQKGRFREFFQCDVDYVGSTSLVAEFSVIGAVTDALAELGFEGFTVRLNDRRILTGFMEVAEIPAEQQGGVLSTIDKLDKIGRDGVIQELKDRGLSDVSIARLDPAIGGGQNAESAEQIKNLRTLFLAQEQQSPASPTGAKGCDVLLDLLALFERTPPRSGRVVFDSTLARGLSYYTGPIFEIAVEGLAGSMGGGGRYDGLVGMFKGQNVPAVGFSLGLERLLVVMEERGMLDASVAQTEILVTQLDASVVADCLSVGAELRRAGIRCEVYPELAKLGKQIQFGEQIGARCVVIVGQTEVDSGVVALKNLISGQQVTVARDQLVSAAQEILRAIAAT